MVKYKDYFIVFEEIPDMVSLAINVTNCQNRCIGCHSPELRCDIGIELTKSELDKIISINSGANCILFMGEGNDLNSLIELVKYIKETYNISVGIYSGREIVEDIFFSIFDYVKVGPYIEKFGPLNSPDTNQRLYKCYNGIKEDITYRFQNNKRG
jgi:anaerobic ribonucleoside-triphosphate reductase activating protein